MYEKLTKIVEVDGRECVCCIHYGTPECQVHSGGQGCQNCKMLGAMLNQLHAFEEAIAEPDNNAEK